MIGIIPGRIITERLEARLRVEDGVSVPDPAADLAKIAIETQVLTPVEDPKVQSQLVQRLTRGEAVFDITAGRLVSKKMDLDETVLGFEGPESMMHYVARFTETLQTDAPASVAEKPQPAATGGAQK